MGVPKRKTSKMRMRMRKFTHRRSLPQLRRDQAGQPHLPHVVDPATGRYRNRQVLTIETPAA
ncbi:MAG: 50S ribosomal protein L32 [Verrucomicrobia bacterium]|nr:50S ribosomal protein L32 [Verrucomicrobiota bacterium]